jgi:hypothetical protein
MGLAVFRSPMGEDQTNKGGIIMPYTQNDRLFLTLKEKRETLLSMLRLRKDKRYRAGLLQGAAAFDVIDQNEWRSLTAQIDKPEPTITIEEEWVVFKDSLLNLMEGR